MRLDEVFGKNVLACKEFFWRLEVFNDTVHGQRNIEVKILTVQNVLVSWLVICYLLFGWSFKGEHYHYRPLVHIPITDHPFLKDYLTRNEPKLHVLNLLNRQKRYNEKLIYDSLKLDKSKMENIFVRFKSVCSAFTVDQGSTVEPLRLPRPVFVDMIFSIEDVIQKAFNWVGIFTYFKYFLKDFY